MTGRLTGRLGVLARTLGRRSRGTRSRPRRPALLEALEPRVLLSFDPTGLEQEMLELLNRMRMDPAGELQRLTTSLSGTATSSDPQVDAALAFFNVSGPMLAAQWSQLSPAPPLAWSEELYDAARGHSRRLIEADEQSHQVLGEADLRGRANAAGYSPFSFLAENVFSFAQSTTHGHAGFALDWGFGPAGIQDPPGHRLAMMGALFGSRPEFHRFREVGISVIPERDPSTRVGPLVITQDFGEVVDLPDPILLGVVYFDRDADRRYDAGEGLGGVQVHLDGDLDFDVETMTAGGWQMDVPAGTYTVTFSGGGLPEPIVTTDVVTVFNRNTKVDHRTRTIIVPEIAVSGNGADIADGDTSPATRDHTSFGAADIRDETVTRTFTIRNLGTADLTLGEAPRVEIVGAHAGDFTLVQEPDGVVTPGGFTTFTVTFDPSTSGTRVARVRIANDDRNEGVFDFAISGTGTARAEIEILGNAIAIADGATSTSADDDTDFGTALVTGQTVTHAFTILNTGSGALNFTGSKVVIGGTNRADFRVTTMPAASVVSGGETVIGVTFDPSVPGVRTAIVTVTSNDADETPYTFTLQGFGLAPEMDITGNGVPIADGDRTPSRSDFTDFGPIGVTSTAMTAVTRSFTIHNTGDVTLTLGDSPRVRITGAHAGDFAVTALPAAVVEPGAATTFTVRFDPSRPGLRTAAVTIGNDDGNEHPYDFAIQGTGVATTTASNELQVGTTRAGTGAGAIVGQTLRVHATGLLLDGTTFALDPGRMPPSFVLGAGDVIPGWEQGLAGAKVGDRRVLIVPPALHDGASGAIPEDATLVFEVAVLGITAPDIEVRGQNVVIVDGDVTPRLSDGTAFGTVGIGQSLTRTFRLANVGGAPLALTATPRVQVDGAHAGDFAVTQPVIAGSAETFTVTFQPTAGGARSARVVIPSNDPDEPVFDFAVHGLARPVVAVAASDASASEIDAATGAVTISRTGPTAAPLTVMLSLAGGALPSDYDVAVTNGVLGPVNVSARRVAMTFDAGAAAVTLTLTPLDDTLVEGTETATIGLLPGTAYLLDPDVAGRSARVSIEDSEPTVSIASVDGAAAETVAGEPPDIGIIRVIRTGATTTALTVTLTRSGTAVLGPAADYVLDGLDVTRTRVVIPIGETVADIVVAPTDDRLGEADERVVLALAAGPGYKLDADAADRAATVIVADNEPVVSIAAVDALAAEAISGEAVDGATFQIRRTGPTVNDLPVTFALGGTARFGTTGDYTLAVGDTPLAGRIVTIPDGHESLDVTVTPVQNALREPPETIVLTLGPMTTYRLHPDPSRRTATVTITD